MTTPLTQMMKFIFLNVSTDNVNSWQVVVAAQRLRGRPPLQDLQAEHGVALRDAAAPRRGAGGGRPRDGAADQEVREPAQQGGQRGGADEELLQRLRHRQVEGGGGDDQVQQRGSDR